jgi:chaperonin GroES
MRKVLADRVLIIRDKSPETIGGIIVPEANRKPSQTARVVAVGNKVEELEPGDKVFLPATCGVDIELDGVMHTLVREIECYCTV